jgi:hypothetical protein
MRHNRRRPQCRIKNVNENAFEKIKVPLESGIASKPYYFGKTVTFVTRSGKILDEETLKRRINVGIPISVHYSGEGDNKIIDRVILDED